MGCVVAALLAAILCKTLIGPFPVLAVAGLALVYAGFLALAGFGRADERLSPRYEAEPLSPQERRYCRRVAAAIVAVTFVALWASQWVGN